MKFVKFPSVEQIRHAIRHVRDVIRFDGLDQNGEPTYSEKTFPTLKFRGYVKLHGTNAAIGYDTQGNERWYQSRSRLITPDDDNQGFAEFATGLGDKVHTRILTDILEEVCPRSEPIPDRVVVYGEWCGRGIMKGVAVNGLDKMFCPFAVRTFYSDGREEWVDVDDLELWNEDARMFNISYFYSHELDIDFNRPEVAQNRIVDAVKRVEDECPVGQHFGVSGVGEGLVYHCLHPDWNDSGTWFKAKGEKHSTSRVKTINAVDVESIQRMDKFIESVVTPARLEWAINDLINEQRLPLEMTSMGQFIRTVYNDVLKEERDVISTSSVDPKKIGSAVANRVRPWFVERVNSDV